jgi:four helix bundle protein
LQNLTPAVMAAQQELPRCEKLARLARSSRWHAFCVDSTHMAPPFTYRDLDVWKLGMTLVEQCYRGTASFPRSELYGLTSQLRRAAVSVPANVAEGHCRRTTKAYANHVKIARGSYGELETCIELAFRLGFLAADDRKHLLATSDSVGRLLTGLSRALARKLAQRRAGRRSPAPSP